MVKEVVHDPILLGIPSQPATKEDLPIAQDLLDTLVANKASCVGMAANMIGQFKRIIVFDCEGKLMVMLNPEIISASGEYETEEGCLSLDGVRPTTRYQIIEVEYQDFDWKTQKVKLSGWTAQIVQHEVDHLSGRII
mgnify:CR=1 FL=1